MLSAPAEARLKRARGTYNGLKGPIQAYEEEDDIRQGEGLLFYLQAYEGGLVGPLQAYEEGQKHD